MKTNINNLILLGAAVLLTACSSKDLFDGNAVENNPKASYAENFAKKYVNIDMNQSWDYSHKQSDFRLVGTSKGQKAMTRAGEGGFTEGDWYEVDNNTLAWMQETLEEGTDNRSLGNPFYMTVPGNCRLNLPLAIQSLKSMPACWELTPTRNMWLAVGT